VIGANGTIGEQVQKTLAGTGHEIVKVGRKSGDFQVEIESRQSVREFYRAVGRLMPWPMQQAESHSLRFRNSPLKSGSVRWEAS